MEFLFVVLVVLLVALLQKRLYRRHAFDRLDYECRFDRPEADEGDEVRLIETVSNRKVLPLPWLRTEITTSEYLSYAGAQSVVTNGTRFVPSFFAIRSFQRTVRSWKVKCLRRGVYRVEKSVLLSTDLLGLGDESKPVKTNAELVVLPSPADLTSLFQSVQRLSGDVVVRRRYLEDPFYIAGVREYTQRDSLNHVHWPATAKNGRLMVHNNQCTADQNLLILLNMQASASGLVLESDERYLELGIRACAGFLEDTLRSGLPVRLAVNTVIDGDGGETCSEEFAGSEHIHDLMRLLAFLPDRYTTQLDSFLEGTGRRLHASDIVIITSMLDGHLYDFAREKQDMGAHVKIIYTRSLREEELPEDIEIFSYMGEERSAS